MRALKGKGFEVWAAKLGVGSALVLPAGFMYAMCPLERAARTGGVYLRFVDATSRALESLGKLRGLSAGEDKQQLGTLLKDLREHVAEAKAPAAAPEPPGSEAEAADAPAVQRDASDA